MLNVSKYLCFTNVERNLKIGWDRAESRKVPDEGEDWPIVGLIRRYYHSNDREISFQKLPTKVKVDRETRWGRNDETFWLADTR